MNCSICFEDITKATGSTTLSCEHAFHFRCIDKWLTKQICDGIAQTCPCCRGAGGEFDRLSVVTDEDLEERDDSTYIPGVDDVESQDADSVLDEIPNDVSELLWERVGEGRWLIISRTDLAYERVRDLFAKENDIDAESLSPVPAASKIQAVFRGHMARQNLRAAQLLMSLLN